MGSTIVINNGNGLNDGIGGGKLLNEYENIIVLKEEKERKIS